MGVVKGNDVQLHLRRADRIKSKRAGLRSHAKHYHELLQACPKAAPVFREPMKCKLVERLPEKGEWLYELKLDGFRALALKDGKSIRLISRNQKDLSHKFPELLEALKKLDWSKGMLDGEIVALNEEGWPSFQELQNLGSSGDRRIFYYAFDLLNLEGSDATQLPLEDRRWLLEQTIPQQVDKLRFSQAVQGSSDVLLQNIKEHALEGIVAKRLGSVYEIGQRTGSWIKYKNLQEQEFVIGGYTPPEGTRQAFGAILVGYYEDGQLRFAAKVGTGFTWDVLKKLFVRFQPLRVEACPFVDLPERSSGRWGQGLTAAKMSRCTWLNPKLVCEVGFTEWTEGGHLRHPAFKGMREDKAAEEVVREVVQNK